MRKATEKSASGLALSLELVEPVVVGLSVPAIIRVKNRGSASQKISSRLNLMEGDVRITIEDPDGTTRTLKGWQADTALRQIELPPGEQIESGMNLLTAETGPLFPKPGKYLVQAEYDPSAKAESVVSPPVTVTARAPRTEAERGVAALLEDEEAKKAIVLATSDAAPDKLQALAREFPETFDGTLSRLLLSGDGAADKDADPHERARIADPVTLARWITMLSTPYSGVGRRLAEKFGARIESRGQDRAAKAGKSTPLDKALRIIRKQPIEDK